jgi:hypothetical protein
MKIRPVRKSSPSPIPTAAEAAANPSLITPAPTARTRRGLGALVGAGLLGLLCRPLAAGADDAPPPALPLDAAQADADALADFLFSEEPTPAPVPLVAPILQAALDEDGRGAFGCIAIDPPVMLSEADALDLIRQEFAKAGVTLLPAHVLGERALLPADRSNLTSQDRREIATEGQELATLEGSYWEDAPSMTSSGNKWIFDLATEDGSLLVEYLSKSDRHAMDRENAKILQSNLDDDLTISFEWSSASSSEYDYPRLAAELRTRFESRPSRTPVTVAIFFDPLVRTGIDLRNLNGSRDPAQYHAAMEQHRRDRKELPLRSREKLRAQVQYFLDWARKEGKIPSMKDNT